MQQEIRETHTSTVHNPLVVGHIKPRDTRCTLSTEQVEPRHAGECVLERGGYSVRPVHSFGQCSGVGMLIERMYSWRGYHTETVATLPSPHRFMLEASAIVEREIFGTLTLGLDSEEGLLADALYEEKINVFRTAGRKVCELSKLAVDPQFGSKEVFASLFHLAYIYAHDFHHATDAFIEVNPRHASFYQRRLGFRQLGELRICPRVNAPAVLLHLELAYMQAQISRHAGSRDTQEKSLYPYFFADCDQEQLAGTIARAA